MMKKLEINGRTYAVVSYISDENCYRLVYLPNPEMSPNDYGAINLIDDTACEDCYGDIDTVADFMAEQIGDEAAMPYPWWTLFGCLYEWGSDATIIEEEESAKQFAKVLAKASQLGYIDMTDEYEARIGKQRLDLEDAEVMAIHTFVNGSAGTFLLANEWF